MISVDCVPFLRHDDNDDDDDRQQSIKPSLLPLVLVEAALVVAG